MPDRRGRASNRVAPKRCRRPCISLFPWASLVINGHPISSLLPPNDHVHPPQLFSSTYCLRLMPVDCSVDRSMTVGDAEIRIDVFPRTGVRPPAGAVAGYDSDGRGRHVVERRRKAHGSTNQTHATIWRTRLRAKAV